MNYGIRDYLYDLDRYGCPEENCRECGCFNCECEEDEGEFEDGDALTEVLGGPMLRRRG